MSRPAQKYYKYSIGKYALADSFYRDIWFVTDSESCAHAIKKIFSSKISLIVFDLTTFSNFIPEKNTVDSEVCFNWQVPPTTDDHLVTINLINQKFNETQTTYSKSLELLNQPVTTMLSDERRFDLQDQIFLYTLVLDKIDSWQQFLKIHQSEVEFVYSLSTEESRNIIINKINEIFTLELTTCDIETQLYNLSIEYIGEIGALPMELLKLLNRSMYE